MINSAYQYKDAAKQSNSIFICDTKQYVYAGKTQEQIITCDCEITSPCYDHNYTKRGG